MGIYLLQVVKSRERFIRVHTAHGALFSRLGYHTGRCEVAQSWPAAETHCLCGKYQCFCCPEHCSV